MPFAVYTAYNEPSTTKSENDNYLLLYFAKEKDGTSNKNTNKKCGY